MKPLVYVVDGVSERRSLVQQMLEHAGYRVEVFATTHVLEAAEEQTPSAMIIATELPDGSGIALREHLRRHEELSNVPVLMLSENKLDRQRYDIAGDDFLCFPLVPERVIGLLEASLARSSRRTHPDSTGVEILIDPSAMKIFVQGKEIPTTTLEFRLLEYLSRHRGKVFTRDALLDAVWGDLQFVTPRSVDACVRRIRRKVELETSSSSFLRTIRGVGYKLEARPTWESAAEVCQCKTCTTARARAQSPSPERTFPSLKTLGRAAFLN
jgi:DNA-binding response OmpR family regulator